MKAYLASHFFNEAGFNYTRDLATKIRQEIKGLDLYVPQENSEINDKEKNDEIITAELIAKGDNKYLEEADILIANIDGVEIDAGVASEIGYFSALMESDKKYSTGRNRIIIGLYTDIRQNGTGENHFYINLYTKGLILLNGKLVKNTEEVIEEIKNFMK